MPGQSGQKWSLVAQCGVMRRRKIRIQPVWMDHLWCDQADHENYDRSYERAARQNPERDSVKFRPYTTGWEGIVDGHDGKTAKTKRHKSDHVLSPCSEHTPKRSHRQYSGHRAEGNRGKNGVAKSQNAELAPPKSALFLVDDYCPVSCQQATLAVQPRRTEIEPRGR
jgi:hypothetical protein